MRILVVEDHGETRRLLVRILRENGYSTEGVDSLAAAHRSLGMESYDALIIDWMLPDGTGLDLCRELRARHESQLLLILSARGEVGDRVCGLDAGADDYIRKPFSVAELLARIRALERRGPRLREDVVHFGAVEVRVAERRVLLEGCEVSLTTREFDILELLLRRRGQPVSRSEFLEALWGRDDERAASSLEVLIARLRRKLSPGGGEGPIGTHRGFGYSIDAPG
jgi:two-component system, OmpR family, response regulator